MYSSSLASRVASSSASLPPVRVRRAADCTPDGAASRVTGASSRSGSAPASTASQGTAAVAASAAPDSVAPAVVRYSTPDRSLACVPAGTTAPVRPVRVSVPVARVAALRVMPRRAQCCSRYSGSAVSGSSWRACQARKSYRPDTAEAVALERAKWSLSLSCGAVGSRLAASRSMRCRMAGKPGMV